MTAVRSQRRPFNIVCDEEVASLLKELEALAMRHDPAWGKASARGKDLSAFQALRHASRLTEIVAGWAIDHQIGLALQGLEYVPRGPASAREHPSLNAALAKVDQHVHEYNGRDIAQTLNEQSPKIVQRLLFNIFRPQINLPYTVYLPLIDGLQALQHGSWPDVFVPPISGQKKSFKERELILRMIGFVAFQHCVGGRKAEAEVTVLTAYGLGSEKIDSWVSQAKDWFSEWHVVREQEIAKDAARLVRDHRKAVARGECGDKDLYERTMARFDEHAIAAAGSAYKNLIAQKRLKRRPKEKG